jgi:hypothetical protein
MTQQCILTQSLEFSQLGISKKKQHSTSKQKQYDLEWEGENIIKTLMALILKSVTLILPLQPQLKLNM